MGSIKESIKNLLYVLLPEKQYLKLKYKHCHGTKLNFDDPQKFSEKLFWLKIYNGRYQKEFVQKCYDKYNAREYIAQKVGLEYLPQLYGIYNNADEIDFSQLPKKYVLKITQSCGYNIINNGQLQLSNDEIKNKLKKWLSEVNDINKVKRIYKEESYCFDGHARILCEEYLEDKSGAIAVDSAFFCFNGEAKCYDIVYDSVNLDSGAKSKTLFYRNIYDTNHKYMPMILGRPTDESLGCKRFENFDKMLEIAETLSAGIPFLRVDLYNLDGRIVVGELTFIPIGGTGKVSPEKYDYMWGSWLKLPDVKL